MIFMIRDGQGTGYDMRRSVTGDLFGLTNDEFNEYQHQRGNGTE